MKTEKNISTHIGEIITNLSLYAIIIIFKAWVVLKFYGWFIKEQFNVPAVTIAQLTGILFLIAALRKIKTEDIDKKSSGVNLRFFIYSITYTAMCFGFGYIAYKFL